MRPRISIVIAYYNRKNIFRETLKSINRSKFKDFELIVVDDGSTGDERIEEFVVDFPFLKIIRIEPKDKWYINPCIPFNIGIKEAKGEIIVLQNPECLHVHDALSYFDSHILESNYITLSAYGMDKPETDSLSKLNGEEIIKFFDAMPKIRYKNFNNCWYNHSTFPMYYHYCSAITKNNMDKLNGFDERYARGIACDDDEFVIRIGRLGLNKIIVDDISVIHQSHKGIFNNNPKFNELLSINRNLLLNTQNENGYRAN